MKTFKQTFNEKTLDDYKIEVFKYLKKKKMKAFYKPGEYAATKVIDFDKNIRVHYNDKDFEKPVFDLEWI